MAACLNGGGQTRPSRNVSGSVAAAVTPVRADTMYQGNSLGNTDLTRAQSGVKLSLECACSSDG